MESIVIALYFKYVVQKYIKSLLNPYLTNGILIQINGFRIKINGCLTKINDILTNNYAFRIKSNRIFIEIDGLLTTKNIDVLMKIKRRPIQIHSFLVNIT